MFTILLLYGVGHYCGRIAVIAAGFFLLPTKKEKSAFILNYLPVVGFFYSIKKGMIFRGYWSWLLPAFSGFLFLFFYVQGYRGVEMAFLFLYLLLLLSISLVDAKRMIIPNELVLFGAFIGVGYRVFINSFYFGLLGAFIGSGLVLAVYFISRGGLGFGDVKLMFVLGLWTGGTHSLYVLTVACILAGIVSVIGLVMKKLSPKSRIPFGPFLCMGGYFIMALGG